MTKGEIVNLHATINVLKDRIASNNDKAEAAQDTFESY